MSFLFKKVAAQDAINPAKKIVLMYYFPRDCYGYIEHLTSKYATENVRKDAAEQLLRKNPTDKIRGIINEYLSANDSCGEDSAQYDSNEEIFMNSHIRLFNEAKEKGDAKFLDWLKRSWNAAKAKPNYKAMSNNPAYRKLDKLASDECESAEDAAEFKVGDKVKRKAAINGSVYKIIEVGRGFHGETIYKLSGHTYPYEWYKEHEIVAADSAAMDDLNDGIKTIENKARALIADAKNARSKYADILASSEIAKNNTQVKKTFEDDIARCDKLINALKAI